MIDGELGLMDRVQLRLHLAMCRGCRAFIDQMRITDRLAKAAIAAPEVEGPDRIEAILARSRLPDVVQDPDFRKDT
ncbi:MAG: zf-HC2 domain-containing protein [Paracoccus sp.]|nr:zf-HC2 domain-containing protein [Paracoccus sp. (in: a-proteobacteria)]